MTTFILACIALILLSTLFYLLPGRREAGTDEDLARANLDWYRLREQELAREDAGDLEDDARLRMLEDEQQSRHVSGRPEAVRSFPRWLLLPVIAVGASGLYYALGAAPDVMITRQLQSLDEASTPQQMQALMAEIEERVRRRPGNLAYVALLGRYYMGQQDYAQAAQTYGELAQAAPEDAQALAYVAQAQYLAAGRTLSDSARMNAEKALAIDPHQRTALGLLGMASFEQEQFRAAIDYWQRLLAMEPPDSESAGMIASVIARAQAKLGETPAPAPAAVSAPAPVAANAGGAGVTVSLALPEGGSLNPSDTVFVLARNAESDSRMPIAVQRLQASQLPITLRLDDSNSMAGQKLSETDSVVVVVQVSPRGTPGEANATWLGHAGPMSPSVETEPLDIVLTPKS